MRLTVGELAQATNGKILYGDELQTFQFVSTDSRGDLEGKLFIPIKGEKFDGHDYIEKALENGATGYLQATGDRKQIANEFTVLVSDTKKALGDLARYVISKSNAKVIGITGSVGKTTTRQFIAQVVAILGKTLATEGNFNNDIGLPLTILKMDGDEKFVVLEMGMNSLGEISYLSNICRPDIAVITLIGTSHIEFLGSRENILKAKLEILDGMKKDGILVLNGDDPILLGLKDKLEVETKYYGIENNNIKVLKSVGNSQFEIDDFVYDINIDGYHNIINASAAVLIGKMLGCTNEQIQEGLHLFKQEKLRQSVEKINGLTIILDCYNASLDSDLAALSVLSNTKGDRKVAILGAIGELGKFSEGILNEVGAGVVKNNIDILICIDENSNFIRDGAINLGMNEKNIYYFSTRQEFYEKMNEIFKKDDVVLIKASRKYKFEEIYNEIVSGVSVK
jgi:UDP-N-acetylmuramoyl-tripeptide--D-alanyl-D-alanine ligase